MTPISSERGMVLMLVIWILTILMVIVLSLSYMTRVESRSTIAFKEGIEEKFIAEAGVEMAAEEIIYRKKNLNLPVEEGKESQIWKTDGTPNNFDLANGSCLVRIINEGGKIDINKAPEIVLRTLISNFGFQGDEADTIVDSILDWRDPDNLVRLHGAEDEYYMSLPVPYKTKNADFESIEELLLVKGVTQELFYGNGNKPGLADLLTVYSESGKINISAAPKEALMAIPGITPEIADSILEFRKTTEITDQNNSALLGDALAAVRPYIAVGAGNAFTVESVGRKSSNKAGYGVKALIIIGQNNFRYSYYRSPWDMSKWTQLEQKEQ